MYCSKCGTAAGPGAKFCAQCGAAFGESQAQAATAIQTSPQGGMVQGSAPAMVNGPMAASNVSRSRVLIVVAFALFAAGTGAFWYAFSFASGYIDPAGKIGYIIGFYFWVPLLVYWVWKTRFNRQKGMGVLLSSIAFFLIAGYQTAEIVQETAEDQRVLAAIKTVVPKLLRGEPVSDVELANTGTMRPALTAMRGLTSAIQSDFQAFVSRTSSPDISTLLASTTLQNPSSVKHGLEALGEVSELLSQTETKINSEYDSFSQNVHRLDLPYNMKADFQNGAESGLKAGRAQLSDFVAIERDILTNLTELLTFMQDHQGRFIARDNRLFFARDADAATYNKYVQKIQAGAQRESAWRAQQTAGVTKRIESIQQLGSLSNW